MPRPAAIDASPLAPPRVVVDRVGLRFGSSAPALEDLSLVAEPGEFVGLVGPSGCGKSTLLRMLAGLLSPTSGTIRFERGSAGLPRTAFVFQHANLLPWRTALANVALPLELSGVARAGALAAARERLALVGLAEADGTKMPDQLSGGMRMRVSIARALSIRPDALLLDEPFGSLDEISRGQLHLEVQRLHAAERRTTFFVTHDVSEALFLSDRTIVLSGAPGRVAAEFPVPFARPREEDLHARADFAALRGEVSRALRAAARERIAK